MSDAIGVGMLGHGFMGTAHVNAYRTLRYMAWPPPLSPELVAIAGLDTGQVEDARRRFGFRAAMTDWHDLISDPAIELFDNVGPNGLHAEPTIAAARAGKHVVCEKPLGRDAKESFETWQQVEATGVIHMCAFNYRFVPAFALARELIQSGEIGEIHHVRGSYLQDWGPTTEAAWRFKKASAGSGALGDLGAHLIDLVRFLIGEVASVSAAIATFQPGREVDDAFSAAIELDGGALGQLEASRFATGRKNALRLEVNGSRGSIAFDLERINELQLFLARDGRTAGFRTILVTEGEHPYLAQWWPPGHVLGWEHTFVNELVHLLAAIRDGTGVGPLGATLRDGYCAAEICDAVARSAANGTRERVTFRS